MKSNRQVKQNLLQGEKSRKKPFYKIFWFWMFAGVVLLSVVFLTWGINSSIKYKALDKKYKAASGNYKASIKYSKGFNSYLEKQGVDASKYNSDYVNELIGGSDDSSESLPDDESSDDALKFGESADFSGGGEKLTVTVNSASIDPSVDLNDAEDGDQPLVVSVTIKNIGSKPAEFNAQAFNAYDTDGNLCNFDSGSYENSYPNQINANQKISVKMYFDAQPSSSYSVTYGDGTWK